MIEHTTAYAAIKRDPGLRDLKLLRWDGPSGGFHLTSAASHSLGQRWIEWTTTRSLLLVVFLEDLGFATQDHSWCAIFGETSTPHARVRRDAAGYRSDRLQIVHGLTTPEAASRETPSHHLKHNDRTNNRWALRNRRSRHHET